jgi:hypothetical protein
MARLRSVAFASCAAVVACFLTACPGGGGDDGGGSAPPQFSVSPTLLSFSAASPNAGTPPPQVLTATVGGVDASTLFLRIVISGTVVVAVDNIVITGPNSGQMNVHVASPSSLATGAHGDTITVIACTTDINCSGPQLAGSPATIDVVYQVGAVSPPPDAVAPSVGTANVEGDVILRGSGFAPVTSVSIGGLPAVSFDVLSSTEIRATYQALPAGPQPVSLNNGAIPFTASLQVVDPPAFIPTTLQYPQAIESNRGLVYDARNAALLVGAGFSTQTNNQVWRYAFDGTSWQATPDAASVSSLRDLTLSLDGTKLLTINDTALIEIDPVTLVPQPAKVPPPPPGGPAFGNILKAIVAANDGQAVIAGGGPNLANRWLYAIAPGTFAPPALLDTYSHPVAGAPADGSRVVLIQGGTSPARAIRQYSASSGVFSATSVALAHFPGVPINNENINPPVFDRHGSRMIVAFDGGTHAVFDASFSELGRVPSLNTAAYALSPDGSLAFTLQISAGLCRMRGFVLFTPPGPGVQFPQIGPDIDLSPCPASRSDTPIRMIFNSSGDTLFIAGDVSISVVRVQ